MQLQKEVDVKSQVENNNTLDYQSKPISVKLTKKLEEQLDHQTPNDSFFCTYETKFVFHAHNWCRQ